MQIKFQNKKLNFKTQNTLVVFAELASNIKGLKTSPIKKFAEFIKKKIHVNEYYNQDFLKFDINLNLNLIIVKTDFQKKQNNHIEKIGAGLFEFVKKNQILKISFLSTNIAEYQKANKNFFEEFILGMYMKSYEFDLYKTKKNTKILSVNLHGNFKNNFFNKNNKFNSLIEGVKLAKDLVSEPGNILHPNEYAQRIKKLKSYGLKVRIFDKKKLKQLGMNALLGVGQGSIRGSYLAIIEWNGLAKKKTTISFCGKGRVF